MDVGGGEAVPQLQRELGDVLGVGEVGVVLGGQVADRGLADVVEERRIAEQLERSRNQAVHACDVHVLNGTVELHLHADEDITIARWATERQGDVFRKAFGRALSVS